MFYWLTLPMENSRDGIRFRKLAPKPGEDIISYTEEIEKFRKFVAAKTYDYNRDFDYSQCSILPDDHTYSYSGFRSLGISEIMCGGSYAYLMNKATQRGFDDIPLRDIAWSIRRHIAYLIENRKEEYFDSTSVIDFKVSVNPKNFSEKRVFDEISVTMFFMSGNLYPDDPRVLKFLDDVKRILSSHTVVLKFEEGSVISLKTLSIDNKYIRT